MFSAYVLTNIILEGMWSWRKQNCLCLLCQVEFKKTIMATVTFSGQPTCHLDRNGIRYITNTAKQTTDQIVYTIVSIHIRLQ